MHESHSADSDLRMLTGVPGLDTLLIAAQHGMTGVPQYVGSAVPLLTKDEQRGR